MSVGLIGTLLGLVVGVVCLGVAAWVYVHPPRRHILAYQTAVVRYFDEARLSLPNKAAMTFKGDQVVRLARTTVVLWNAGTEALRGEDIVPADPLRISIAEGQVLHHRVLQTTSDATKIRVEPGTGGDLEVRYCYLNPDDGVAVEVVHDGLATAVTGTAKGLTGGPESRGTIQLASPPLRTWFRHRLAGPTFLLVAMAVLAAGMVVVQGSGSQEVVPILGLTGGFLGRYIWVEIAARWRARRRHPLALSRETE